MNEWKDYIERFEARGFAVWTRAAAMIVEAATLSQYAGETVARIVRDTRRLTDASKVRYWRDNPWTENDVAKAIRSLRGMDRELDLVEAHIADAVRDGHLERIKDQKWQARVEKAIAASQHLLDLVTGKNSQLPTQLKARRTRKAVQA
ncbi:MAG: hypothetical protein ABFD92_02070 [Planctomycetaceae bacterium]|nr:hypothetical protein [Planctomycetaceae bacterium]